MEANPNIPLSLLVPVNYFDTIFLEPLSAICLKKEHERHSHHVVDEGPGEEDCEDFEEDGPFWVLFQLCLQLIQDQW